MGAVKKLKNPESLWLICILNISAALRLFHYGSFSYSNDELSALNRLHYDTFSELVAKGFYVDGHPGGIQVFLWKWVSWFGDNEWVVRLPFVLMGILAVWMSYRVAKLMFGISAGLYTATALTFLQFPLLYSQIARPYGPGLLFGLILVFFWLKVFFTENSELNKAKPRFTHLAGFALSSALCMYTHYFSFLFALIVGFSGFVVARRNNLFQYIAASALAASLFVPHIPITLNHLSYKGVGDWLGVPSAGWILEHFYYIFNQSLLILILVLATLLILMLLNKEAKNNLRFRLLLATWFLGPVLIGYFYSVTISPVLQHPVLIFSFPYFIILVFSYAGNEFTNARKWLLLAFLASGVLGTTVITKYYQQQHFGEFKDIGRLTAQYQGKYGKSGITKVININNPLYIDYYLYRYQKYVRFDLYSINGAEGLSALSETVKNSRNPYFLYATTKPTPAESMDIIRSQFPYIIDMKDYGQYSSIFLFARDNGSTLEQAFRLIEIKSLVASLDEDTLVADMYGETVKSMKLDSTSEYSPGVEINFDEFRDKKNLFITAEADIFSPAGLGEAALVISIESNDGKSIIWKGAASKYIEIPGKWSHLVNTFKVETKIPKGAKMKIYFWNKDKKIMQIHNLVCSIYQSS